MQTKGKCSWLLGLVRPEAWIEMLYGVVIATVLIGGVFIDFETQESGKLVKH